MKKKWLFLFLKNGQKIENTFFLQINGEKLISKQKKYFLSSILNKLGK